MTMKVPFHISKSKYNLYKKILSKKYGADPNDTFATLIHSALDDVVNKTLKNAEESTLTPLDRQTMKKWDLG